MDGEEKMVFDQIKDAGNNGKSGSDGLLAIAPSHSTR